MNRTVKIHSMESKTITPICFRFQVNKCPFGDMCKYRHIKDPNITPRDTRSRVESCVYSDIVQIVLEFEISHI